MHMAIVLKLDVLTYTGVIYNQLMKSCKLTCLCTYTLWFRRTMGQHINLIKWLLSACFILSIFIYFFLAIFSYSFSFSSLFCNLYLHTTHTLAVSKSSISADIFPRLFNCAVTFPTLTECT